MDHLRGKPLPGSEHPPGTEVLPDTQPSPPLAQACPPAHVLSLESGASLSAAPARESGGSSEVTPPPRLPPSPAAAPRLRSTRSRQRVRQGRCPQHLKAVGPELREFSGGAAPTLSAVGRSLSAGALRHPSPPSCLRPPEPLPPSWVPEPPDTHTHSPRCSYVTPWEVPRTLGRSQGKSCSLFQGRFLKLQQSPPSRRHHCPDPLSAHALPSWHGPREMPTPLGEPPPGEPPVWRTPTWRPPPGDPPPADPPPASVPSRGWRLTITTARVLGSRPQPEPAVAAQGVGLGAEGEIESWRRGGKDGKMR